MEISVISGKCKIKSCTTGKSSLDPCDEFSFYTCDNLNQDRLECAKGTHFDKNDVCSHLTTPSAKSNIWETCGIPKNLSTKECRKIWPINPKVWNKTKINEFLTRDNFITTTTTTTITGTGNKSETVTETAPQKDNFLIPFLIVFFILIASIVILIFYLRRRNYCKRPNSNKDKNDQQTEENEEEIYAEIDENQMRRLSIPAVEAELPKINQALDSNPVHLYANKGITRRPSIPAVEADLPKIDQALDSNPEHLSANKGFTKDEDDHEELYNVAYVSAMHLNGKSSETLPGGYSSENIDPEEYPDNPYFVLEKESDNRESHS